MYRTIILELVQANPTLHERLRSRNFMMQTIDRYAMELKTEHQGWMKLLREQKPGSDLQSITSEALELATEDILPRLLSEDSQSETDMLDDAMAFIRSQPE